MRFCLNVWMTTLLEAGEHSQAHRNLCPIIPAVTALRYQNPYLDLMIHDLMTQIPGTVLAGDSHGSKFPGSGDKSHTWLNNLFHFISLCARIVQPQSYIMGLCPSEQCFTSSALPSILHCCWVLVTTEGYVFNTLPLLHKQETWRVSRNMKSCANSPDWWRNGIIHLGE